MLLLFAKGFALYGFSWVLWRIFGKFIVRSPLDNIPGPASKNWLKGVNKQTELDVNDDSILTKVFSLNCSIPRLGTSIGR